MSKYTTEVRFICEQQSGLSESNGYNDVGEIIEIARTRIFDFNYPIFDSNYKPTLETKILMHYYTREISEETYGLWKLRLRTRLNEIMPYYNKLYESELIEFNPLWDTDLTTERDITNENEHQDETVQDNINKKTGNDKVEITGTDNREAGGTDVTNNKGNSLDTNGGQDVSTLGGTDISTLGGEDVTRAGGQDVISSERDDKTNTWDLYSDTPQGSIAGIEGAEDSPSLGDNGYLTNARHVIGDTDGSSSQSTNTYGRNDTTEYGRTNTMDYGRSNTTEYGKTLENEFEKEESVKYGRTDKNEYDKNVDTIYNNQDKFDGKSNTSGTAKDSTDYLERVTGYRGRSPIESIMKLRESFLNIDNMIIKELRDLFFNLW